MRKPTIAAALLSTTLFGVGYAVGQAREPAASSAAGATPTATLPAKAPGDPLHGSWANLGPRADGTVAAINGNTVTVKKDADLGQAGEYGNVTTIVLTGGTVYEADRDSNLTTSKTSIKVGSYIVATGTLAAGGTSLTAAKVSVMSGGRDGSHFGPGAPTLYAPNGSYGPSA
ncbi:MAG: hypothetical protein ACR2JC_05620 [Chloroflexota bacterium]